MPESGLVPHEGEGQATYDTRIGTCKELATEIVGGAVSGRVASVFRLASKRGGRGPIFDSSRKKECWWLGDRDSMCSGGLLVWCYKVPEHREL